MMPATASQAMIGAVCCAASGKNGKAKTQKAVRAELEQNCGQNYRPAGGRLHVSVGQPGVQRKERHLDHEGQRERKEAQQFRPTRQGDGGPSSVVEGPLTSDPRALARTDTGWLPA